MPKRTQQPKIIVLCGPTGIGKTETAIAAATRFGGEIVNADSMQVYRYLDIGTAKPTREERLRIRHHLIDIVDPDHPFDAALYSEVAGKAISKLDASGVVPFVVGGTGLYIKALIGGLFSGKTADLSAREELKKTAQRHGIAFLHDHLRCIDPDAAEKIHPNDRVRIVRAIEVHQITGKTISELQRTHGFSDARYRTLKIGLDMDRTALYEGIDRRAERMIEKGLHDEVYALLQMGYSEDLKPLQSIGYRHMIDYLSNRMVWEVVVRTFKRDTRRYAKRQLTWFRADPGIHWFRPDQKDGIYRLIEDFLEQP